MMAKEVLIPGLLWSGCARSFESTLSRTVLAIRKPQCSRYVSGGGGGNRTRVHTNKNGSSGFCVGRL